MKKPFRATKLLALLLAFVSLLSVSLMAAVPASAAAPVLNNTTKEALPNPSSISIRCFTRQTSGKIYCFTGSNLGSRGSGWIDAATDEIKILRIEGDALYIEYPVGRGTTRRWFSAQEILGVSSLSGQFHVLQATQKITTYKRYNGGAQYGSVGQNDKIYVIGFTTDYSAVIYPLSGGGYKLGYVKNADLQNYTKPIGDPKKNVQEGTYVITSALNGNLAIDIANASKENGANAQLYYKNGTGAQSFQISYVGNGYYTIKNTNSNKVLDVKNGHAAAGTNVWQFQSNATSAQQWRFVDAGNGYFYIVSKLGYYLDVAYGSAKAGANLQIWWGNKSNAQKFKLVAVQSSVSSNTATDSFATKVNEFLSKPQYQNDASWGAGKTPLLSNYDCSGCCAYAADFVKYVFNKATPCSGTSFTNISEIRAGDILVFSDPHWIVVLERYSDGRLKVAEGNVNSGKVRISDNVYMIRDGMIYAWGSPKYSFSIGYHFR